MTDPAQTPPEQKDREPIGADKVAIAYILGGIPAIVGFIVILFTLVNFYPDIPA